MKKKYPRYKLGELDKAGEKLSKKDKETLALFLKKCSITAGEKKVKHIRKLIIQLADVTQIPLTKQTRDSVDSFLSLLSNSDKSYWTKDELKIYIKQFLLWLYEDLKLVENFKSEGKKGLNPQKVTENNLLTEGDIEKMVRFAQSYKDKAYLLLAFQTGARPQELLGLKFGDVKFDCITEDGRKYAEITLFSGKTKQSRTFPIVEETMAALWEWKQHYTFPKVQPQDFIFVSRWRDKAMTTAGLNKMLRKMAVSSGIEKDVWSYLLRHTRATRLYEELPQQIVEKLMGHKNMAGIYAHISSKKAREEMLNKVYKIEKLTTEEKKEIRELKEKVKLSLQAFNQTIEAIKNPTKENAQKLNKIAMVLENG